MSLWGVLLHGNTDTALRVPVDTLRSHLVSAAGLTAMAWSPRGTAAVLMHDSMQTRNCPGRRRESRTNGTTTQLWARGNAPTLPPSPSRYSAAERLAFPANMRPQNPRAERRCVCGLCGRIWGAVSPADVIGGRPGADATTSWSQPRSPCGFLPGSNFQLLPVRCNINYVI